jgi:alpha-amylase
MKYLLKSVIATAMLVLCSQTASAQGWPENYGGVMLQGFYWDSFAQSKWTKLESQAEDFASTFDLIWVPQSGNCGGTSMGYDDLYWFPGGNHYTSSFGTEVELRNMISTFKSKGIGVIADVVVNHRKNVSNWVDFPLETYNGVTYQMKSTDICKDDDGGATLEWANSNGYSLSSNNDSGEGWGGMRDLDHHSTNVQNICKAYTKMLIDDLGYTGFRYDMVKGFSGSYVRDYNNYAKPQFSVGECWDSSSTISGWIDGTENTSAAFDFQFKYVVRNAVDKNDWTWLGKPNSDNGQGNNYPLNSNNYQSGNYRRYAVTFVENHDTEVRADGSSNGPLRKDTLAANAYLLAMPGTPCVFLKHWQAYKPEIAAMIAARKAAGITNTSTYSNMVRHKGYYANLVNSKLLVVVGNNVQSYNLPNANYIEILSGYHYRFFMHKNAEIAWVDKASGEYNLPLSVKLSAISADANAQLVYTLDGSEPTASSTKVASGTSIEITGACTLKVGLLIGSTVSSIITREYTIFQPYDITIYVNTDKVGWSNVNFWTWGGDGTHAPTNSNWPGDKVSSTTTINGKQWYAKTYTINSASDCINFVFSTGTGKPQTIDINDINETTYFEISTDTEGDKNKVNDVTSTTDIEQIMESQNPLPNNRYYNLNGQQVVPNRPGIYIHNGRKFVIK